MRFMILTTVGLLGCLSEQGLVFDVDAGSETESDGTTPDGTTPDGTIPDGTTPDGEVSDRCRNVVCDDNDDCTVDQCNPETGECEYFGVPGAAAPAQCVDNADCEDGDPCTGNTCVFVGCGAGSYCTSEPVPGCGTSCATGCADDDPCTRDICRADICYNIREVGCDAECITGPLYGVQDVIMGANAGMPSVKATGLLTFDERLRSCDDGPQCGCQGYAQLSDGGFGLALRGDQVVGQDAWSCSSVGCGDEVVTCDPAHAAVRYRVWGPGLYEWDLPDADVIASYSGVAVQGFCLETQGTALVGNYKGQVLFANYTIDFDAAVRIKDNSTSELRLAFGNATCDGCPLDVVLPEGDVALDAGSGYAEFDGLFPSLIGPTEQRVRLYSNRNTLAGEYGGVSGINFIAPPQGGTITLTRLAP